MDRQPDESSTISAESKFFSQHASNKLLIQAINQYFKRLNNKDNFVEKTIKKIGYPRWDKAITVKFSGILNRGASDSTELTYIPFVREEDSVVNASLLVQTSPTDTAFKYICDWQYQYEQNGLLEDTAVSAERIALTLMILDKEVFGRYKYKLTDNRLFESYFPDSLRGNQSYLELGTQAGNRNSGRTDVMAEPVTFTIYCSSCVSHYWQIIYYYNLNGIPTWEFVGSGGGSGNGGNSGPPDCPGIPVSRNQDVTDPCQPGWVPDPNGGGGTPPQIEPVDSLLVRYSRAIKDTAIFIYDNLSKPTNIEYALTGILQNGQIVPTEIRTNNDSLQVIPKVMIGRTTLLFIWHSHVSLSLDPRERGSFSPDDIDMLRNVRCLTPNFISFADCRDKRYALVITDVAKATEFFNNNNYEQIFNNYTATYSLNTQEYQENCIKNVIGSSTLNGIALYVSNDAPGFQTWTQLNP